MIILPVDRLNFSVVSHTFSHQLLCNSFMAKWKRKMGKITSQVPQLRNLIFKVIYYTRLKIREIKFKIWQTRKTFFKLHSNKFNN